MKSWGAPGGEGDDPGVDVARRLAEEGETHWGVESSLSHHESGLLSAG